MRFPEPHPPVDLTRRLRSRVGRMLALVWLVSQTAGGVVMPIADALAGHGTAVVAHVEDDAGTHCPPAHSEVGCHLAAVAGVPSVGAIAPVEGEERWQVVVSRPRAWDDAPPVGAVRALPLSRGPPLA
ncbi:MAG: hypothetical protein ACO32Z_00535 [Gemmatimonadaceae bacterium]